jgi:hypothetical protein
MDKGYDITLHSGQQVKKTSEVRFSIAPFMITITCQCMDSIRLLCREVSLSLWGTMHAPCLFMLHALIMIASCTHLLLASSRLLCLMLSPATLIMLLLLSDLPAAQIQDWRQVPSGADLRA